MIDRQQLHTDVLDALRDMLAHRDGIAIAPTAVHHPDRPGTVVVDHDGERADIVVDVRIDRHTPPGWTEPVRYVPGNVVELPARDADYSHQREPWEIIAVLGDRADPRPGYRLRHIGRAQSGAFDRTQSDGTERVVTPDYAHSSGVRAGGV